MLRKAVAQVLAADARSLVARPLASSRNWVTPALSTERFREARFIITVSIMLGIGGMAAAAAVLTTAAALLAVPAHSQTGVWHQAFERPSSDAVCEAPPNETPWQASFSGQREWTPSWAQWPNDGRGGWVCQRSVVWATTFGVQLPSAGCLLILTGPNRYADFQGGFALPGSAPLYSDSGCASATGQFISNYTGVVYAPPGFDANTLCQEAFGVPSQGGLESFIVDCNP